MAKLACQAAHPVRKLVRGPGACRCAGNYLPDVLAELQVLNILCKVIKPANQVERVPEHGKSCLPETGCYPEPGLLSKFDHDPVVHRLDCNRDCGLTAGARPGMCPDLDSHFITFAQYLGVHTAVVELCEKSLCNVGRR